MKTLWKMLYKMSIPLFYTLFASLNKCGSWHHPFSLHQVCPLVAVGNNCSTYFHKQQWVITLKDSGHDERWGNPSLISYKWVVHPKQSSFNLSMSLKCDIYSSYCWRYHNGYRSCICLSLGFILARKTDNRVIMLTMMQGSQSSPLHCSDFISLITTLLKWPQVSFALLYYIQRREIAAVSTHGCHRTLSPHVNEL